MIMGVDIMRKILTVLAASAALFGFSSSALAFDSDFGVKAGQLSIENDSGSATQVGLVYSMDLAGIFGVEFEGNTSVADGDAGLGVDYSVAQFGGYGVVMTPGPIYFKGKAGYVYNDIDIGGASDSDSDVAYGVGVGAFGFEFEYTRSKFMDADVDLLSVSFKF